MQVTEVGTGVEAKEVTEEVEISLLHVQPALRQLVQLIPPVLPRTQPQLH